MSDNTQQSNKRNQLMKILVILFLLSSIGLIARYAFFNSEKKEPSKVVVPENVISETGKQEDVSSDQQTSVNQETGTQFQQNTTTETTQNHVAKAPLVELYANQDTNNERFVVENMLPGDQITKYYAIKTSHNVDVSVYFQTLIQEETKSLGDVLQIKVTNLSTKQVLCDDVFTHINQKSFQNLNTKNESGYTVQYYQIDIALDKSVGNEYQGAQLVCDFKWYVTDEHGSLTPNQDDVNTGDVVNQTLWITLIVSSLLIFLMLASKQKGRGNYGK